MTFLKSKMATARANLVPIFYILGDIFMGTVNKGVVVDFNLGTSHIHAECIIMIPYDIMMNEVINWIVIEVDARAPCV